MIRLYGAVKVDREIDFDKHYFSPGSYCIEFDNGRRVYFDFFQLYRDYNSENGMHTITWEQRELDDYHDEEDFCSEQEFSDLLHKNKIVEVHQFFIYMGEDPEDEEYEILEISEAMLWCNQNGKEIEVDFADLANARWQKDKDDI